MWYNDDSKVTLNYNKPICCKNADDHYLLLVPQMIKEGSYDIAGFNWLNIVTGRYQSSCFFETAEKACKSYAHYMPINCSINLEVGDFY